MASVTDVGKFESLNFFIHERLTTVAGEIFQLLKETLCEFQEEVFRCRQENIHLKRRLAESSSSTEPDVQIKHAYFPLEDQNSSQGLVGTELDSETSAVQVKVEFSTLLEDPETQQPLCHYSTPACNSEPSPVAPSELPHDDISAHIGDFTLHESDGRGDGGVGVYLDSYVTVKLERCDSQLTGFDQQSYSSLVPNGSSANDDDKKAIKDEPAAHCVQSSVEPGHVLPPSQCMVNSMTGQEMSLFRCKTCPKTFEHAEQCKAHMQKHRKEAVLRCEFCRKCYRTNSAFQNHIKTHHIGEHPYHCRFCNMTFSRKSSLEEHERIRPYSCTKCGKHFIWLNQARLHVQNDHPENTDTIIKRSTKHGMLRVANTSVGENHCELCGKNYSTRQVLRIHLRTHTGERPYNCSFCNKTFTQKCHMMEHERIHTGEKKYSCSECGLSYRWLRSAKVHLKSHHSQGAKILRN